MDERMSQTVSLATSKSSSVHACVAAALWELGCLWVSVCVRACVLCRKHTNFQ